jgi:hypothetical protein
MDSDRSIWRNSFASVTHRASHPAPWSIPSDRVGATRVDEVTELLDRTRGGQSASAQPQVYGAIGQLPLTTKQERSMGSLIAFLLFRPFPV